MILYTCMKISEKKSTNVARLADNMKALHKYL